MLEALAQPRPRFGEALEGVESGGWALDDARIEQERAIRSPSDLEALDRFLERREGLVEALADLGPWSSEPPAETLPEADEDRDIDVVLTTLGARALLGGEPSLTPLSAEELLDLVDRSGVARGPLPGAHAAASAVAGLVPKERRSVLQSRVEHGLLGLAGQLFSLVGQEVLDPRYVQGILRFPSGSA